MFGGRPDTNNLISKTTHLRGKCQPCLRSNIYSLFRPVDKTSKGFLKRLYLTKQGVSSCRTFSRSAGRSREAAAPSRGSAGAESQHETI